MEPKINDFYLFKNGTIGRIIDYSFINILGNRLFRLKLRKVSSCKGKVSSKERIGKPYTYQSYTTEKQLRKAKRIGTEELLRLLFDNK